MQSQIKRAIDLSKKTGDRVIIVDQSNPEYAFVVMSLAEYEKLITKNEQNSQEIGNLTENELLDRINRDIAIWKNGQDSKGWETEESLGQEKKDDLEDESLYYYDNEEEANLYEKYFSEKENVDESDNRDDDFGVNEKIGKNNNNPWRIPKQVKESAEEVLEEDFY